MRKLTKKALSLLLCVMLIATAISRAFSITAETVGSTTVNGKKVYDAPVGLELDGDLSTWNNIGDASNPKLVAANGVLKAGPGYTINIEEVSTAHFKVPDVVKGSTVKLSFDFAVNLEGITDESIIERVTANERILWPVFKQYNADGTLKSETVLELKNSTQGTAFSQEFVIEDPNEFFKIIFRSSKSLKDTWEVSNITVTTTAPKVEVGFTTVNGKTVYDAPVGFELDGDLSTWNNIGDTSNPKLVAANGVLKAGPGYTINIEEVATAHFKVPDVVKGSTVKLSFDFAVNLEGITDESIIKRVETDDERILWPILRQYNADGTSKSETVLELRNSTQGTAFSQEFVIEDPNEFFKIIFRSSKGLKDTWEVSNITVTTTAPKVEVGFTTVNGKTVYDAPVGFELDGDLGTWNNIGDASNPKLVAANGVLKAGPGYTINIEEVATAHFKVPDVVKGSTVKLSFDFAVNLEGITDESIIKRVVTDNERILWPILRQYNADGTTKSETVLELKNSTQGTASSKEFIIEDPNEFFKIIFRSAKSLKDTWEVSNITVTTTPPNANGAPLYYGNEENGFVSTGSSYPQKLKPSEEIGNLDFSYGFIYWSGRNAGVAPYTGSLASDSFKLDGDENNKYITLKDEGYVDSMRTALFDASNYDVQIGDKLVLIYDAKGDDAEKLRVTLVQDHLREAEYNEKGLASSNVSPGEPDTLVDKNAKLSALATSGDWTTYVTGVSKLVNDPTTVKDDCIENIYLQIVIEAASGVAAGDQLDAAIDNIKIAKIDNGAYYDITTGEKIADMTINAETLTSVTDVILRGPVDYAADFNDDTKVDILDLVYLKKKLAGKVEN